MHNTITLFGTAIFKLLFIFIAFMAFLNVIMGMGTGFFDADFSVQIWSITISIGILLLLSIIMLSANYTVKHLKKLIILSLLIALAIVTTSFGNFYFIQSTIITLAIILAYFSFIYLRIAHKKTLNYDK